MSYGGRTQYGQNYRERSQYNQYYRDYFRRGNFRGTQIIEVKILEVDTEVAIGMKILEEVKVGIGKGSIRITLGGMIEAAVD